MFDVTKDGAWADRAIAADRRRARASIPSCRRSTSRSGETLLRDGQREGGRRRSSSARSPRSPGDVQALLRPRPRERGRRRHGRRRSGAAAGDRARSRPSRPSTSSPSSTSTSVATSEAADTFRRASRSRARQLRGLEQRRARPRRMRCNYPAALEAYRKALALDPKRPEAASNLGMTELWTGQHRRGGGDARARRAALAEELRDLGQPRRRLPLGAGSCRQGARRRTSSSIALAREQLRVNPDDADALAFLATGLARTGHADEARPSRCSTRSPRPPERIRSPLADAAIVAALGGPRRRGPRHAAPGRRGRLLPRDPHAPARVRALARQPGLSLDRRRAAEAAGS